MTDYPRLHGGDLIRRSWNRETSGLRNTQWARYPHQGLPGIIRIIPELGVLRTGPRATVRGCTRRSCEPSRTAIRNALVTRDIPGRQIFNANSDESVRLLATRRLLDYLITKQDVVLFRPSRSAFKIVTPPLVKSPLTTFPTNQSASRVTRRRLLYVLQIFLMRSSIRMRATEIELGIDFELALRAIYRARASVPIRTNHRAFRQRRPFGRIC